ncbi:MAG: carboxypeptidase regulatory-like domain-containing protein, partial [Acidobacteriaceae bacterium]|nr:carboxypeptidase regulatory-like domain-containing protein [Acidobacteriaceae bacterium]
MQSELTAFGAACPECGLPPESGQPRRCGFRLTGRLLPYICLLLPAIVAAQQAPEGDNKLGVVEGTVVHAQTKEPVRKAHVTLELSGGAQDSVLVATTDEAGHFRFAGIKAGRYDLAAEKSGFLRARYGAVKAEGSGSLLNILGGEQMHGVTLELFPAGAICGRVLDSDGDPMPDDSVVLWNRSYWHRHVRNLRILDTNSNRAGEYRFEGLSRGTYYVRAGSGEPEDALQIPVDSSGKPTQMHDLTTFYPAALSLVDAEGVVVESGQEQCGIDIRVQRGRRLSVRGTIESNDVVRFGYELSATVQEGQGWTSVPGT